MNLAGRQWPSGGRLAMFLIPSASILVTIAVLLGPGSPRAVLGARVWGLPAEGGKSLALRLETVRVKDGIAESATVDGLTVIASTPGVPLPTWTGHSHDEGFAEVRFESVKPFRGALSIQIQAESPAGRPLTLAEGNIPLRAEAPLRPVPRLIAGTSRGELALKVDAARGRMASPFAEEVIVEVVPENGARGLLRGERATLALSGVGLDISPDRATCDENGVARFRVKPLAHHVELGIDATAGTAKGHWEGQLPVVPGAIWLEPPRPNGPLVFVSPVPRKHAFVSFVGDEGRILGAVVPLTRDDLGFFRGAFPMDGLPKGSPTFATVAGDAAEKGLGTVVWPIQPSEGAGLVPSIELLLDGTQGAVAHEDRRVATTRRTCVFVILAGALVEILLILQQVQASRRAFVAHLRSSAAEDALLRAEDRDRILRAGNDLPVLRHLVAIGIVALAFAVIAALATFR